MPEDIPLRVVVRRLRRDVDALLAVLIQINNTLQSKVLVGLTLAELRAATITSLQQTRVIVLGDSNGNNGIFKYDAADVNVDNGTDVIIDGSARHWVREQGLI